METNAIPLESLGEEDDFLLELAAAEAEAASAKSSKVTVPETKPPPTPVVEGAYMAALRGSKSELWQQSPLNPSSKARRVSCGGGFHRSDGGGGSAFSNLPVTYGSDAGDEDIQEKHCPCGLGLCLVLTSNTQKNPGRRFYKCPVREENGGCGFFQWCDVDQSSGTYTGTHSYAESKFPDLQCPCGAGLCRVLTAKTGQNIGQQFYRCPVFEGSCGFFKWCNDQTVNSATLYNVTKTNSFSDSDTRSYQNATTSTTCFKCGKEGHWARDCPIQSVNSLSEAGQGKSTSSAGDCYKCGKEGHWARECPAQSGNPLPEAGQGTPTSSARECFKCRKEGHWARDCPVQSDNSLSETVRGKSASSAGDCYKCGKPGHWARDCTSSTSQFTNAPGKRQKQY